MKGQMSIFDFLKPDYQGKTDEILRASIEHDFERQITLANCSCGQEPTPKFFSCKDYFIQCNNCGKKTKTYRHLYEAKQAWNKGLIQAKPLPVIIKGLCDDAYCPKCDYALDEHQSCDKACPKCHTPLDWTPWHKLNDDWWLKHLKNLDVK